MNSPVEEVLAIFEATNIQAVVQNTSDGVTVTGYFPCDSPPTVGFSIPSQANATAAVTADSDLVSHQSAIFNIAADQWIAADNGDNNCTAVLSGATVASYPTLWVVGQRMFFSLLYPFSFPKRIRRLMSRSLLPGLVHRSQCRECDRGLGGLQDAIRHADLRVCDTEQRVVGGSQ